MSRGLTLIELLIVIAIVALLSLISLYNMSGAITQAKVTRAKVEITGDPKKLIGKKDPWGSPYSCYTVWTSPTSTSSRWYSWGPDRKDDLGLISYDPSNGTISKGDI